MIIHATLLLSAAWAGVEVGSYGRIQASMDGQGGQGDAVNFVAYGTRLEKPAYLELDLMWSQGLPEAAEFRVVVTPAVSGEPFHADGQWEADLALRNLYVQAERFARVPLTAWAGSRMARGDDVYLLDFWPMDELNLVGGGVGWAQGGWQLAALAGLNRVEEGEWLVQRTDTPLPGGVGTEPVLTLDRQRQIAALKAGRSWGQDTTLRVQVYGELHNLPAGARVVEDFVSQELPADRGGLAGVQLSAWGWGRDSFVHLWARTAWGLGTVSELRAPLSGLNTDWTTAGAREHLLALAANTESQKLGLMAGGYLRQVRDADSSVVDWDDRLEGNLALRGSVFPTEHTALGLELSHQWMRPQGLNPRTEAPGTPQALKLAVLPALQLRRGGFARPQLRAQYIVTVMNDDARALYHPDDTRHRANVQHFVGLGAEWWLNSATYGLPTQPPAAAITPVLP